MIPQNEVFIDDLKKNGNSFFPDMIKFCIDIKRRVICIDGEMHIDMEHELYDDGSKYEDIYGGNIMIDCNPPRIEWEAHPNIERNRTLGGHGRIITDEKTIAELNEILCQWVK